MVMLPSSGKGSARRPLEVGTEVFETNWDRIFNKHRENKTRENFMEVAFSEALLALKLGKAVSRHGWNSSLEPVVYLVPADQYPA